MPINATNIRWGDVTAHHLLLLRIKHASAREYQFAVHFFFFFRFSRALLQSEGK